MANYKRNAHRGRHKKNVMDNQGGRLYGNSESKTWGKKFRTSRSKRNQIAEDDV